MSPLPAPERPTPGAAPAFVALLGVVILAALVVTVILAVTR